MKPLRGSALAAASRARLAGTRGFEQDGDALGRQRRAEPGIELLRIGAGEHLGALGGGDGETAGIEHGDHRLGLSLGLPQTMTAGQGLLLPSLVDLLQVHRHLALIFALLGGLGQAR